MKKKVLRNIKIGLIALLALSASFSYGQVIFTSTPDSIAVLNSAYNYQVVVTYAPNAPTYSLLTAPAGMTIGSSTGLVTWTPASMSAGGKVIINAHNNLGDYTQTYYVYITDAILCDANIISYWPMDEKIDTTTPETIHGYVGHRNSGYSPNPTISSDAVVGNAMKFDPSNNLDWGYNVKDVNQYEFKGTCQFSVSLWFKNQPSSIPLPHHKQDLIGRWAGLNTHDAGWRIVWNPWTETMEFTMRDHGPTDTTVVNPTFIAQDDYEWHHVVATFYNGTNLTDKAYMHLYVDGVSSMVQYDFWTDDFDGTSELSIGSYFLGEQEPYSGLLDEITIWNKELVQGDVNALRTKGLTHQPMCQEGNTAPLFTSTPVTSVNQDAPYSYTLKYREIDGDAVTKSAPVLPAWLSFNATTGLLSGTPTNSNVGNHNVTLRLNDGTTNVDQSFVIAVNNVNDLPSITSTPGTSVNEDVAYSYTLVANDIDPGATLTYSAPVLPAWMSFNTSTHVLSGTPTNDQVGKDASKDYAITLRVTDNASASVDQSFTLTVVQVNDAPVINSQNSLSTDEDVPVTIALTDLNVTDVDDTYPTDFTLTVKNGSNYTHTGNAVTPSENWNGTLTVPIDLSDGTATVSYDLSVEVNAVNDAPSFTSSPVLTITSGETYQYWITTNDPEDQTLTLSCTVKPSWLTLTANTGSGLLQGMPSRSDVGNASVTLHVSDGSQSADQSFTIVVSLDNNVPVFTSEPVVTASIDELYTYAVTATDADAENLTFSAPTKPSWLDFNATSHVLSGIPASANAGDNAVVIAVTDGKDEVLQSFTISVATAINNATGTVARVYPMPASDYVMFEFAVRLKDATLDIFTTTGELIQKLDVSGLELYQLDVTNYRPNQYIYRIITSDGQQTTGPLVVE